MNVLALDALANATVFEYRQLSLTMEQINQLSRMASASWRWPWTAAS